MDCWIQEILTFFAFKGNGWSVPDFTFSAMQFKVHFRKAIGVAGNR